MITPAGAHGWMSTQACARAHTIISKIRKFENTDAHTHDCSQFLLTLDAHSSPPRVRQGAARRHVDAGVGCNEDCGAVVLPERG